MRSPNLIAGLGAYADSGSDMSDSEEEVNQSKSDSEEELRV